MKIIVINNPAAKYGGALSILKEFLEKISTNKCSNIYHVIVSQKELKKYENNKIKIHVINVQNFKNRILWDNFFLRKFLNKKKITPDIFISLQNTGVNINKKITQIIYYHQLLTLSESAWNFFEKEERIFWLYKNIYKFFIMQYLKKTSKIIVQAQWIKEKFSKKFNYDIKNIQVIEPIVQKVNMNKVDNILKSKCRYRIFYPALPLIYKNHKLIIESLGRIMQENKNLLNNVECIFTYKIGDMLKLDKLIEKYQLNKVIKLVGVISYKEVLEYYKTSNLLVFPSYIETFGLPLIEAQQFNLEILTVDLIYSKEVLKDYKKVEFINSDDIDLWKREIQKKIENR